MSGKPRLAGSICVALVIAALGFGAPAAGAHSTHQSQDQDQDRYRGRSLAEALRALQAKGLRIVFTSAIVTPALRVQSEPRARAARHVLDELLAPHGLEAREGPGGVIQIVLAERRQKEPRKPSTAEEPSRPTERAADSLTHTEHVTVSRSRPYVHDRGAASEMTLERDDLAAGGGLVDDPIRAVHALPRVSVADDFRSELTVRGSPFRQVGFVVDGVATPWLQHTAIGRGATGSLTMLSSQVLDQATLRVGAYPHRFGDRLGAELEMTVREGSRQQLELRGAVGGTNATIVGEGPLGRSGERARGSWLVSTRQSYLEWPSPGAQSPRTAFGFTDGLAKVVFDVRPHQKVGFTLLEGMSNVDGEESPDPILLGDGTNRTTLVNLFWRSTLGSSLVITQRAYVVRHRFRNKYRSGSDASRGTNEEVVYRADLARRIAGGLLETGVQVGRTTYRNAEASVGDLPAAAEAASWQRSSFAHFAWSATRALTLSPGVRVTGSSVLSKPTVARWILAEYALGSGWALSASAGASRQLPELYQAAANDPATGRLAGWTTGQPNDRRLRPERATHVDLAIERRLGTSMRWQTTLFSRSEADLLREPDLYPRLVDTVVVDPSDVRRYLNSLSGSSHGIELLLSRQGATGLSGWAAYSYGRTRYVDAARQETFWADFDRRHTLNLFGLYRLSDRTNVGATFRAGSGFPIPAYLTMRDGMLVVGDRRNDVRLPFYARLDLRASRTFEALGRRVTAFIDVANALNRANLGAARGSIRASTGEAVGFTDRLLPRRASAGVVIEF